MMFVVAGLFISPAMISIIAAMDKGHVIGIRGKLPWNIPADLSYFHRTTIGHPIIMGRKTFQSIGHTLPERENIIVSRTFNLKEIPGAIIKRSLNSALQYARKKYPNKESFIIGGGSVFRQIINIADRLYVTFIDGEFRGDAYFPDIDSRYWKMKNEKNYKISKKNPYRLVFALFERKA